MIAGERQNHLLLLPSNLKHEIFLSLPFQKVVIRRKGLGTRPKGAGAKEVVAVPGTRQVVVAGTATRVRMWAVVNCFGNIDANALETSMF